MWPWPAASSSRNFTDSSTPDAAVRKFLDRASALLYALKSKIESFAERPSAEPVLFAMAFVEASLVPLPPDILFLALAVARPRLSFRFATVCIAGSVTGAMAGYMLGALLFDAVGERVLAMLGLTSQFSLVLQMYREHAWTTLLLAGFTNIPFSVFTIAAGFRRTLDPMTLFLGALAGRAVRFYLLGVLLTMFGPAVKRLIDRSLPAVSFGLLVLFVAMFLVFNGGR
jgi:membrane protein YqaA with SNARE-associated domain